MKMSKEDLKMHLATHPHRKDLKHQAAAVAIGIFAFLAICATSLIFYGMYTKDKIAHGVSVAGVSIGGLTYETALEKIKTQKESNLQKELTIQVNNENFSTTAASLGVSYEIQKAIDEAYTVGKQPNLFYRAISLSESLLTNIDVNLETTKDETKIDEFIAQVTQKVNKEPQNASIKVEGINLVDIPAIDGIGVDTKKLKNTLLLNISNTNNQPIIGAIETLKAPIQVENLTEAKNRAKTLTNYNISLTFETFNYTIDQSTLMSWLEFPVEGSTINAHISEAKMKAYVDSLAKKIDIKAVDRKIADIDKAVIDEGKDGRALNRTALMSAIKNIITKNESAGVNSAIAMQVDSVTRGEKIVRQPFTPGLYPGKYIEVNISTQRMYLWEGTNKIGEHIVSTGNIWSTPTPIGTRYIENKITNAWSNTFKLYMPFWMSVGGGYGIHELPYWPDGRREGANALGRAVSHGCIRLGIGPAQEVYNFAEIGIPVYIHTNG